MKLILHHLAKDIRAQRWLLILSFLVIALQIALDALETQSDYHVAAMADFVRATGAPGFVGCALWILLLARLIQSEPVIGDTSFWLTRPIPRRVYIPSKFLFIALFLVLPWLLPVPLDMLHFGVDPHHVARWVRNSLVWDGYLIIALLWIATFTRNVTSLWAVLLGAILAGTAINVGGTYFHLFALSSGELIFTRWAVFILILSGGLLVSLVRQHARRKATGGVTLGIAGIVAAIFAGLFFPFALPMKFSHKFIWSSFISSNKYMVLHFSDDWRQELTWQQNDPANEWVALSAFSATDAPATGTPVLDGVNASFMSGYGNPVNLTNRVSGTFPVEGQFDFNRVFAADLPGFQLENMPSAGRSWSLFTLNRIDDHDLFGKSGELKVFVYGSMRTLVREAVIPLGGPGMARSPGEVIHVARFDRQPDMFIAGGDHDKPVLAVWTLSYSDDEHFRAPQRYYLLAYPPARTAKLVSGTASFGFGDNLSVFSSKTSRHVYIPLRGDEALGQMVLYIYALKSGDTFGESLSYPNFIMNPQ